LSLKTKVDSLSVVCAQNHWDCFLRFGLKTGGDDFLVKPQNQGGGGFSSLSIKIGGYCLMIWTSKLLQRFLGLEHKIKQASVYQLRHKTNGRIRRRGTRVKI
jgi:hypothetical protein